LRRLIHLYLYPRGVHCLQHPRVPPPSGARHLELDKHPRAHKSLEMRCGAQHPVKARRGHLQRVRGRNRVIDIEESRDFAAYSLAVIHRDPLTSLARSFWALRPIDEDAHHCLGAPCGVLELDQLIAQSNEHRLNEGDEPLSQGHRHRNYPPLQTKMGQTAHPTRPRLAGTNRWISASEDP
jgi:hypothetical protein